MALTVPDQANASFSAQADLDAVDIDAIVAGMALTGVVTGCAVTQRAAGINLSVDVAAGTVAVAGTTAAVTAGNVAVTADATNPRFALITSNASGTLAATMGTAAANPAFPAIPASSALLAAVWIPAAATTIANANIVDKRVNLAALTNFVDLSTTQSIGGQKTFTAGHALTGGNAAATAYGTAPATASLSLQNIAAATSTNKVQLPGAMMQFGQYWDGALTQFWSTAVGSTVDSAAGKTRMIVTADTVALSGGLEVGTKSVKPGTLSLPATANTATALGQFSSTNGALALRLHLHLTTGSVQRTKTYEFVVDKATDATGTYYKLLPADQSTAQSSTSDVFLVALRPATATNTWQFWVCTSATFATSGIVNWMVESYGDTIVTYASALSPSTAAPTLPFAGGLHPSNTLDTVAGTIGVGTDAPTSGYTVDILANSSQQAAHFKGAISPVVSFESTDPITASIIVTNNTNSLVSGVAKSLEFSDVATNDSFIRATAGTLRIGVSGSNTPSTLRITSTDAQINDNGTARSLPRGLIGIGTVASATAAFSASTNMATVTVPVVSGRKYRVHYSHYTQSFTVSGDIAQYIFAATNATFLTNTALYVRAAATTNNTGVHMSTVFQATATGNAVVDMNGSRQSGTGTITVSGNAGNPRSIWVEDIGT